MKFMELFKRFFPKEMWRWNIEPCKNKQKIEFSNEYRCGPPYRRGSLSKKIQMSKMEKE
jgi:hypothetical protein